MINNKKSKYLIISIDALRHDDLPFLRTLPNFSKLIDNGCIAKRVQSIFPSVTYPCHATILTGCYPSKHGIYNNYLFTPGNLKPNWFWEYTHFKKKTLIDCAIESGLKVSSIFWPVTAGLKIPYNIPEVLPHDRYKSQFSASMKYSSKFFLGKCYLKHGSILKGIAQPQLDDFAIECALDSLKKNVDFALFHFTDLDSMRHSYGTKSKESFLALKRHDLRLGRILSLLKERNELENTSIFLLGDHSFKDVQFKVHINSFLREKGFITLNDDGSLKDYSAYAHKCDGSCEIFLKDGESLDSVVSLFHKDTKEKLGIKDVLYSSSLTKYKVGNNIKIMLNAKDGYKFTSEFANDNIVEMLTKSESKGEHGYLPDEDDYSTLLICSGRGIKTGVTLEKVNLIDIAPTFSKLLGCTLPQIDGRVISEFLNKGV